MSPEENKSTIFKTYEFSTQKNIAALNALYDPGYIEHTRRGDVSLEKIQQTTSTFFEAFPDCSFTVENMVAEGDMVAYQVIIRGTHQGMYLGVAPTGNQIEMWDTSIKRIVDGKLVESWGTLDTLSLMQQLGVIPRR